MEHTHILIPHIPIPRMPLFNWEVNKLVSLARVFKNMYQAVVRVAVVVVVGGEGGGWLLYMKFAKLGSTM